MVCEICICECLNAKFIPLKCIDEINATNQVANNTNCNFFVLKKSVYLKRRNTASKNPSNFSTTFSIRKLK